MAPRRDHYVDDMIFGLMQMMDSGKEVTGPINLGNPTEITILGNAQTIIELIGSRSRLLHLPLPQDDPKQRRPDIGEAERILGWKPTVPLKKDCSNDYLFREASGRGKALELFGLLSDQFSRKV